MAKVPRWQQGFRPLSETYGEVWDAMTPEQRRNAFLTDILICALAIGAIFLIFGV